MMQSVAKENGMVLIVPIYEEEMSGIYYNYRRRHRCRWKISGQVPQESHSACRTRFLGKVLFQARAILVIRVLIRRLRESVFISAMTGIFRKAPARSGLNGAEIIFNPSATVAGLSEYLWKLEQPAHAVANGYFVGAINRVGHEQPWDIGEFYGQSYFCDPRGQIIAEASRDKDELVVADLDMDLIREVRNTWQFFPRSASGYLRFACRGLKFLSRAFCFSTLRTQGSQRSR